MGYLEEEMFPGMPCIDCDVDPFVWHQRGARSRPTSISGKTCGSGRAPTSSDPVRSTRGRAPRRTRPKDLPDRGEMSQDVPELSHFLVEVRYLHSTSSGTLARGGE